MNKKISRRDFVKKTSAISTGIAMGTLGMSAKSYGRIKGANERLNFAIAGLHGRGKAHLASIAGCKNTNISHICDVDKQEVDKFSKRMKKNVGYVAKPVKDFRKLVEIKDIDVVTIAAPDHWHAPMALMGLQAGKHVYLEKPCTHNPYEGELLLKAQKKYKNHFIQMGNQQRSSDHTIKIIQKIYDGLIGDVYYGKAWYSNTRGSIGVGKKVPVPDYLDWELWQGPAPRKPYKDNVHPYNWHWFWRWGTGESLNNGTHEIDICRWALKAGYPKKVTASGGRYHFKDDWQFYDTMVTNFEYDDKMITWEGKSCQGKKYFKRGRGSTIHGTKGTVLVDRNGYDVYSLDDKLIDQYDKKKQDGTMDIVGSGPMTTAHFQNLINAIRKGEKLHSPIYEGNISVNMLHYTNIAWKLGRGLTLNQKNGKIVNDTEAAKLCSREYEKGWEPKV